LLRFANSAFFSGLSKVSTIKDSILRLGTRQVTNIVLLTTQHRQYGSTDKLIQPYLTILWKHAACCAKGSNWLAHRLGYRTLAQESFLAGLMHDIGHLFLLKVLEDLRTTTKGELDLSPTVLNEILNNMHTTHGGKLMESWNLPVEYCEIVRHHHDETFDGNNKLLAIVRLVNQACHKIGIGLHPDASLTLAATAEAQTLEVSDLLAAELEIMLEDTAADPENA
jgi:HD-like signal output (HDOD) protein